MSNRRFLIINLKRNGDIFQTAHFINELSNQHPGSMIDLLCLGEFNKAASILGQVKNIITIDRKKIETILKSPIFSDGFALNHLSEITEKLSSNNYERIINISNDKKSTLLTTLLSKERGFTGIKFNSNGSLSFSNYWSRIYNECLSDESTSWIHLSECMKKMEDINSSVHFNDGVVSYNKRYDKIATESLGKIRDSLESKTKLIGIQLKSSTKEKDIPRSSIIDLISDFMANSDFFPVLLIAPTEDEKNYANGISDEFNNSLIIIESDFVAAPSVLKNLDAVITPDTSIKHLADLTNTPLVEISTGMAPFRVQGTLREGNIIIRSKSNESINAGVILQGLNCLFKDYYDKLVSVDPEVSIYRSLISSNRLCYKPINLHKEWQSDLSSAVGWEYISKLESSKNENPPLVFENITFKQFQRWSDKELIMIQEVSKALLSTIRSLLYFKENKKDNSNFVEHLNNLLSYAHEKEIASVAIKIFKSKAENDLGSDKQDNLEKLESSLYELKNNLQSLKSLINKHEECYRDNHLEQSVRHSNPKSNSVNNKLSYL